MDSSKEALALIETLGFLPAVEAADAMVKTAKVSLTGFEKTTGGLVLVTARGEVAACREAVEAARIRASRVGKVLSVHVIPRPSEGLPGPSAPPEVCVPPRETAGAPKITSPAGGRIKARPAREAAPGLPPGGQLAKMNVPSLRHLARQFENFPLKGRAVSRAGKKELLDAFSSLNKASQGSGSKKDG